MSQISISEPHNLADSQTHKITTKTQKPARPRRGSLDRCTGIGYPPTVFLNRILLVSSKRCDYFYTHFKGGNTQLTMCLFRLLAPDLR